MSDPERYAWQRIAEPARRLAAVEARRAELLAMDLSGDTLLQHVRERGIGLWRTFLGPLG